MIESGFPFREDSALKSRRLERVDSDKQLELQNLNLKVKSCHMLPWECITNSSGESNDFIISRSVVLFGRESLIIFDRLLLGLPKAGDVLPLNPCSLGVYVFHNSLILSASWHCPVPYCNLSPLGSWDLSNLSVSCSLPGGLCSRCVLLKLNPTALPPRR